MGDPLDRTFVLTGPSGRPAPQPGRSAMPAPRPSRSRTGRALRVDTPGTPALWPRPTRRPRALVPPPKAVAPAVRRAPRTPPPRMWRSSRPLPFGREVRAAWSSPSLPSWSIPPPCCVPTLRGRSRNFNDVEQRASGSIFAGGFRQGPRRRLCRRSIDIAPALTCRGGPPPRRASRRPTRRSGVPAGGLLRFGRLVLGTPGGVRARRRVRAGDLRISAVGLLRPRGRLGLGRAAPIALRIRAASRLSPTRTPPAGEPRGSSGRAAGRRRS